MRYYINGNVDLLIPCISKKNNAIQKYTYMYIYKTRIMICFTIHVASNKCQSIFVFQEIRSNYSPQVQLKFLFCINLNCSYDLIKDIGYNHAEVV